MKEKLAPSDSGSTSRRSSIAHDNSSRKNSIQNSKNEANDKLKEETNGLPSNDPKNKGDIGSTVDQNISNQSKMSGENSRHTLEKNKNKNENKPLEKIQSSNNLSKEHDQTHYSEEIKKAITDAESEDYRGISRIILRGDGQTLVGASSKNEDVQRFLDELPESLVRIILIVLSIFQT